MSPNEPAERDRRLLELVLDGLPNNVSAEQHQEDIASILEFIERLHVEHGTALPGWLDLGRQLYPSHPRTRIEPT